MLCQPWRWSLIGYSTHPTPCTRLCLTSMDCFCQQCFGEFFVQVNCVHWLSGMTLSHSSRLLPQPVSQQNNFMNVINFTNKSMPYQIRLKERQTKTIPFNDSPQLSSRSSASSAHRCSGTKRLNGERK